jgi:hypothetical protein
MLGAKLAEARAAAAGDERSLRSAFESRLADEAARADALAARVKARACASALRAQRNALRHGVAFFENCGGALRRVAAPLRAPRRACPPARPRCTTPTCRACGAALAHTRGGTRARPVRAATPDC